MQWRYQIVSFNTHDYSEHDKDLEDSLNKYGHDQWEAVSMSVLPNGWTRVLFRKPDR